MSFWKYQHNKLLAKKYYKITGFDLFNSVKFADYFNEYSVWVNKLDLPKDLKILDIGSDYGSLYHYLKYRGFNIIEYNPYDYSIFKPFTINDINEFYNNYNFIKVDCEGCEFEIFKYVDINKIKDKALAIAIHENSYYDQNIAQRIISICPYQIFKIGFETIYTNSLRGVD
ncbi:MAG: hypothetical protein RXO36_06955 [Candidatus Nanopusillus acidilobi]